MRFLILTFLIYMADVGMAYPDNIRLGYQSCSTCHVDPNGGGILTLYGRSLSEEMATWSYQGEGQATWNQEVIPPEWINVGGDYRYLGAYYNRQETTMKHFPMQAEIQAALKIENVHLVGSYGHYGPLEIEDYRTAYAMIDFNKYISLRAGKFQPAFGIRIADHTIPTGGQWLEEYGYESRISHDLGEITSAVTFGPETPEEFEKFRYHLRAAAFIGKEAIAGLAYRGNSDGDKTTAGAFFTYAPFKWLVAMGEARRDWSGIPTTIYFGRLGVEAEGVFLYTEGHGTEDQAAGDWGVRWIPRPHMELTVVYGANEYTHTENSYVGVLHFWL